MEIYIPVKFLIRELFGSIEKNKQFEKCDNQCDVLRAALCDSRDVLLRGCVILCVKRLHDFCACRGCVIFLRLHDSSQSLTHSGCMIDFFWRLLNFFLWRGCVNFFLERLHDFFGIEVPNSVQVLGMEQPNGQVA